MLDEQQTVPADDSIESGSDDANVEATSSDAPTADTPQGELGVLNEVMGRNFATLEEAKKHYQSLNSLVGDNTVAEQRRDSAEYNALVDKISAENGWSKTVARQYIKTLMDNTPSKSPEGFDPKKADVDARVIRAERTAFLATTPEAKEVIENLDDYVRNTGMAYEDAYGKLYGEVYKKVKLRGKDEALREEKKLAQVSASTATPEAPKVDAYATAMKEYSRSGKRSDFREAIKARWDNSEALKRATGK